MDNTYQDNLFALGPIIGWVGHKEARILVEVSKPTTLVPIMTINETDSIELPSIDAKPYTPILYLLLDIPSGNDVRIEWNNNESCHFHVGDNTTLIPPNITVEGVEVVQYRAKGLSKRETKSTRVAVISCNGYSMLDGIDPPKESYQWKSLRDEYPNLMFHLGDQVYNDCVILRYLDDEIDIDGVREEIRNNYIKVWNVKETKEMLRCCSNVMFYDDHEYRNDWSPNMHYYSGVGNFLMDWGNYNKRCVDVGGYPFCKKFVQFDKVAEEMYMKYQVILWGRKIIDIFSDNRRFVFLDSRSQRDMNTYFGQQINDLKKRLNLYEGPLYIMTQSSPFTAKPYILQYLKLLHSEAQDMWSYRQPWLDEYTELIDIMYGKDGNKREGAIIGGDLHIGQNFLIDGWLNHYTTSPITTKTTVPMYDLLIRIFRPVYFGNHTTELVNQNTTYNYLIIDQNKPRQVMLEYQR
jgi:hypothetical protein